MYALPSFVTKLRVKAAERTIETASFEPLL